MGYGRARAMLLAAEPLDAQTALQTGMANRIGELADAQAWAAELAGFAPLALKHAKRVLNDDGAFEDQWPEHKELFDKAWGSQDIIEAQVARIQKRPPTSREPERAGALGWCRRSHCVDVDRARPA
ncbi:putative enoyl-CoA hydratase echA6 [Mycobacteroides abscessus MAB_030201_1075]|uniref:Putative enoyl-CoA hydratase echA6 n=1 Tax=Mycobacteroides abscessus MAB_030201_1075 TaxID=1335410 RepID=A0A829PML1_9MYCO|nr:putative enoyl-CoA hydratase echA6 [Mycobacteroides abscessus MAB_030201_1075]